MAQVGICNGDICNRGSCQGVMYTEEGVCACHTGNPPCGHCVDAISWCDVCGAGSNDV